MQPLKTYADEFVAVIGFLLKNPEKCCKKGFLFVPRKQLETLLDKNHYETSENKLRLWKRLHWIDGEDGRLTRRLYNPKTKKQMPMIKVDLMVYETLESCNGN